MPPVFGHAGKAFAPDQITRVPRAGVIDRLLPIVARQRVPARLFEPVERPFIMTAEIITTDHDRASLISFMSCGGRRVSGGANVCWQLPLPPLNRMVSPLASARAEPR